MNMLACSCWIDVDGQERRIEIWDNAQQGVFFIRCADQWERRAETTRDSEVILRDELPFGALGEALRAALLAQIAQNGGLRT